MRKLIPLMIISLLAFSLVATAIPDEWGRVAKHGPGSEVTLEVREVSPLEEFFLSIFTVLGLQPSYERGQNVKVDIFEEFYESCNNAQLSFEVYNAQKNQQTTANYQPSLSTFENLGSIGPSTWFMSANFIVPENAKIGTWSVSGYINCPEKRPRLPPEYSEVDEINFEVTGEEETCTDECSSQGITHCTTHNGISSGWVTTCGNFDSDSCLEWASSSSQLISCGGADLCENGQCVLDDGNGDDGNGDGCPSSQIKCTSGPFTGDCRADCSTTTSNPIIEIKSNIVEDVGLQAKGKIRVKNTGESMSEEFVLEMQINPVGAGVQALLNPSALQTTCDSGDSTNVHIPFQLISGEEREFELIAPQTGILSEGTYEAWFVIRKDCTNALKVGREPPPCTAADNDCNLVVTDREEYGSGEGFLLTNNLNILEGADSNLCKKSIGQVCEPITQEFLGLSDGSGPSDECASGWCRDIRGGSGRCSMAGLDIGGERIKGAEPHPTCVAMGTVKEKTEFDIMGEAFKIGDFSVSFLALFIAIGAIILMGVAFKK